MTDTLTIPAHIENGSLHLDAPLPKNVERVEVIAHVSALATAPRPSVAAYVRSLPLGTSTGAEIEARVREERESWPD
jgi:hypothetical protein